MLLLRDSKNAVRPACRVKASLLALPRLEKSTLRRSENALWCDAIAISQAQ
jgi:hypothetical protein